MGKTLKYATKKKRERKFLLNCIATEKKTSLFRTDKKN